MKDYGFDYMNYITNIPSNMMDNDNSFYNQKNKMKDSNLMDNSNFEKMNKIFKMKDSDKLLEPYEGLIRGNIFENLYEPYKNFKPSELNPDNEREALIYQIMQYSFALIELNLHLDTHPNDREVIELYNKYSKIKKEMCKKYESMYGPLVLGDNEVNENRWEWINSPWPWEVM